jgi:glutamine cyclotransferase
MSKKNKKTEINKQSSIEDKMKILSTKSYLIISIFIIIIFVVINVHNSYNSSRSFIKNNSHDISTEETLEKLKGDNFKIKKIYPKNDSVFYTQGLVKYKDNEIIESGGMYKESVLVKMEYPSMKIINKVNLSDEQFAEGIARVGNKIYQLTWKEDIINVYNADTLEKIEELKMDPQMLEGWGLTDYKDGLLVATDSRDTLFFLDDKTLQVKKKLQVTSKTGRAISNLNDLTYDGKFLYINVYYGTYVLKVDPNNGKVVKVYELKSLIDNELKSGTLTLDRLENGDVLNGIEYDKSSDSFILTGKKWGHYYEAEFN